MYADKLTDSMSNAIKETYRRREIQEEYNKINGIVPQTIIKEIGEALIITQEEKQTDTIMDSDLNKMTLIEKRQLVKTLEEQMRQASRSLNFQEAMMLRDAIIEIKATMR